MGIEENPVIGDSKILCSNAKCPYNVFKKTYLLISTKNLYVLFDCIFSHISYFYVLLLLQNNCTELLTYWGGKPIRILLFYLNYLSISLPPSWFHFNQQENEKKTPLTPVFHSPATELTAPFKTFASESRLPRWMSCP